MESTEVNSYTSFKRYKELSDFVKHKPVFKKISYFSSVYLDSTFGTYNFNGASTAFPFSNVFNLSSDFTSISSAYVSFKILGCSVHLTWTYPSNNPASINHYTPAYILPRPEFDSSSVTPPSPTSVLYADNCFTAFPSVCSEQHYYWGFPDNLVTQIGSGSAGAGCWVPTSLPIDMPGVFAVANPGLMTASYSTEVFLVKFTMYTLFALEQGG